MNTTSRLISCNSGTSGIYKEVDGDIVLTLSSDGRCNADHGRDVVTGRYEVNKGEVHCVWDGGEEEVATIKGSEIKTAGLRLVKQ